MDEVKIRDWILERSTDRFLSRGFGSFTMDEIARDAGISKKTLYRLIPSKKDLILMVMNRQIEIMEREQQKILENSSMDFKTRLESLFRIISDFYSRMRVESFRDMAKFSPDLWELIRQRRAEALDGIIRLLEKGRDDGNIRDDISPGFLGRYIHSTIDSLLTPRAMMEEDMTPNQMLDITLSLIFHGIQGPEGDLYE